MKTTILRDFTSKVYRASAGSSRRGQQRSLRRWCCLHTLTVRKLCRFAHFFPPCSLPNYHYRTTPLVCRGPFSDLGKDDGV